MVNNEHRFLLSRLYISPLLLLSNTIVEKIDFKPFYCVTMIDFNVYVA